MFPSRKASAHRFMAGKDMYGLFDSLVFFGPIRWNQFNGQPTVTNRTS